MPKKDLNQNTKYYQELINSVDYNFDFNEQPLNRFKTDIQNTDLNVDKFEQLLNLKQKINSIENCKLKNNSKKLIMGDGNVNSPIMLIGESPSNEEEVSEQTFKGQSGELLKKMFIVQKSCCTET